jgi:DNA invertase Pin-like site-specific DNA recombinase
MLGYMSDLYRRGSDLSTARLAIYVRASEDSEDTETSVNAQRQRGEQWAAREGITDVKVYCDNDLSASLYARKDREDFDRLCADVDSGDRNLI